MEIGLSWTGIYIAESQLPITHSDLKKLERHVVICRAAQELVGNGGVNVAHRTISNVMNVRDEARKRWSICKNMTSYKSFLNEYDMWVVATYVCFERNKL